MNGCCSPRGYRRLFSEQKAQSEAKRYRSRGPDTDARRVIEPLLERGVEGSTILEIGGGIGVVQLELLRSGASRAVSVELTPTYEDTARVLLHEAGFEDRVERRVIDFVEASADVESADVVVMNRVVCCYPDMPRLVGAAAEHTRGILVMSFPKSTWWTRWGLAAGNLGLRVARREFQVFLHPPDEIRRIAELHGLRALAVRTGVFWQVASWERPTPEAA